MESKNMTYVAHEMTMTGAELKIRRLWITAIMLLLATVGSNLFWVLKFLQ